MGSLTVATPPDHTALVRYSDFKAEQKIADADDAVSQQILADACDWVVAELGRPLVRAQYTERLRGSGHNQMVLRVFPLVSLDAITYQGNSQNLADFSIVGRDTGTIEWGGRCFSDDGRDSWVVTYTAGYFLPDDNLLIAASAANADNSYNSVALFPTHAKPGDTFAAGNFTNAENNGNRNVVTATTSKIVVPNTLTTEASAIRQLDFNVYPNGLPGIVTRAVMMVARESYLARTYASGGALIEETIAGATTLRYSAPSTGSVTAQESARDMLHSLRDL